MPFFAIDIGGRLNVAWLDIAHPGWQGPLAFGANHFVPGAAVEVFRQSETVVTALVIDQHGTLNVAWLDTRQPGWQGPLPIGTANLLPGAPITAFRQSATVIAALTVDRGGSLNVAWLDLADPLNRGWQGPVAFGFRPLPAWRIGDGFSPEARRYGPPWQSTWKGNFVLPGLMLQPPVGRGRWHFPLAGWCRAAEWRSSNKVPSNAVRRKAAFFN